MDESGASSMPGLVGRAMEMEQHRSTLSLNSPGNASPPRDALTKHKKTKIVPSGAAQRSTAAARSGAGNGGGHMPSGTKRTQPRIMSMLNPWGGNNHPLSTIKGALTVTVKTGGVEGAGTDSRIWMRIHGKDKDSYSPVFELEHGRNRHSFARDQVFKFDLLAPYPEVSLRDDVDEIKRNGESVTPLCGDIKKIEIWRDDGRDVALDGEDPSWFLARVLIEEPYTGEHWDFIWGDWVEMTMSERALKAIDSPDQDIGDQETAMARIAACPPGAKLEHVVRYDTMHVEKVGGLVNVSNSETELQWWSETDGVRHYVLFTTIDRIVSVLIIFTILSDVFREELVKDCVLRQLEANGDADASGCNWASAAESLYPWLLFLDLFILVIFLLELLFRFALKYWGLRNVFAHVLKSYNRRYRKLGLDAFKKNGIRRSDPKRTKFPWFRTLYAPGNEQFRKEFEDVMDSDLHARQRIPFNFLPDETMSVVIFELCIVVGALVTQSIYIAVSKGSIDAELTGNTIAKVVSIMRVVRVTRIVTRISKLRQLVMALAMAFSGVLWILVLVLVGSYAYAIVGVMTFRVIDDDSSVIVSDDCGRDCVADNLEGLFGSLWSACKTLFFNILLGDNIGDVLEAGYNGPARNWIYVYVISYLVVCVFLLMEAVTGYIVDIISSRYQDQRAIDALPFAAVARIRVVDWYESLKFHPNKKLDRTGEQPWLGAWMNDAIKTGKINVTSVSHVRRMLRQVQTYNLEYAQMEFEPRAGSADYEPSDWLIGVRSEAEMTRLIEQGFMYWDKKEEGAPRNPSPWEHELDPDTDGPISLTIPVSREHQGDLIQVVGLHTPWFAVEDHVLDAFREYGIVLKVEREKWDLPEDSHNPDEIAQLEKTKTLLWRVRLYLNEKKFPVLPVAEFDPIPQAQLRRRGLLECEAIEIYGQMCPILAERVERPTQRTSRPNEKRIQGDDTGLAHILPRFETSELFEFAQTFTPDEDPHLEKIEDCLDSVLPKQALVDHLTSSRSVLHMIQVPAGQPFPSQPTSEARKRMEKTKSSSGPRKMFSQLGWTELMVHVEHYRAQGLIRREDEDSVDASSNPKDAWIDILCKLEHEQGMAMHGSGWKSKWDELREATESLKVSLYMTCAGIRDLTIPELHQRALEDSGVKVDELNAAVAYEMWLRADNEGKEDGIRKQLAPLLHEILGRVRCLLHSEEIDREDSALNRMSSSLTDSYEEDLSPQEEKTYYETSCFGDIPLKDLTPESVPLECFFLNWDSKDGNFTSTYICKHPIQLHREVSKQIIALVNDRADPPVLPPMEIAAAKREGAIKAILRHFDIGGVTMLELDKHLDALSNSARSHSKTMAQFSVSELYKLAQDERLDHKFVNYKRERAEIIPMLVSHEQKLAKSAAKERHLLQDVSLSSLREELERKPTAWLKNKAEEELGWVAEESVDQLSASLNSEDPKRFLLWRLLEAGAHPAPIHEPEGFKEIATKGFSLSLTVPEDGWEQTEKELRELAQARYSPNIQKMLDRAYQKVHMSRYQMALSPTTSDMHAHPPVMLEPWASQMKNDLAKVYERSEKLDRHTTKLHDKVTFMTNDLSKILRDRGRVGGMCRFSEFQFAAYLPSYFTDISQSARASQSNDSRSYDVVHSESSAAEQPLNIHRTIAEDEGHGAA